MTLTHAFYIPMVIILGFAVGYVLGARAGRAEVLRQHARSRQ